MNFLDDNKNISTYDTEDMYHKIIHLPEQIHETYFEAKVHKPGKFEIPAVNRIVICGMGGSAISGDIAKSAFSNLIPIEIVKDYNPPKIDDKTLFIALSYSGNTEETLTCLKSAMQTTSHVGAVTSGGELKKIVSEKHLWIELTPGYPPRSAIGYLFFSLMKLLENFEIIPNHTATVKKVIGNLVAKAGAICSATPKDKNLAKISAEAIQGKIPIIYSGNPIHGSLAYRWKCQINENAKYPAFWHTFPEMNHNEIEGWEINGHKETFIPIFLLRLNDDARYKKRVKVFKNLLDKKGIKYLDFFVEGDTIVEEFFSLNYLGDMISYYLAILQKVNPTTIDYISYLKEELSK